MQLKTCIALTACAFLISTNCLAWIEYSDDQNSSQVYDSNNYSYVDDQFVESDRNYYQERRDDFDNRKYSENTKRNAYQKPRHVSNNKSYSSRMPGQINTGEKTIIIDPRVHAWGAYSATGKLIRSGVATSGGKWCSDIGRSCRTKAGNFRIVSLGNRSCYSKKFPVGKGGAPMPYCMYFNGGQALHGSHDVSHANRSHGCVRLHVADAKWIRFNFATVGTKVIIKSY